MFIGLFIGCLTSQQHAGVSQGRICTDNVTCCHTEIEVADQTFYLTHSQYTDTGPSSPSTDPITPGRVASGVLILSHWYDSTRKNLVASGLRKTHTCQLSIGFTSISMSRCKIVKADPILRYALCISRTLSSQGNKQTAFVSVSIPSRVCFSASFSVYLSVFLSLQL